MNIGEAIKLGLTKKGMTQTKLAQFMGVTPGLVSQWIKNISIPPGNTLLTLANTLDIVPDLFPGYIRVPIISQTAPNSYSPEMDEEVAEMKQEIENMEKERAKIFEEIKIAPESSVASLRDKLVNIEQRIKDSKIFLNLHISMERKVASILDHIERTTGKKVQSIIVTDTTKIP